MKNIALNISGLTISYGNKNVLDDINISVEEGTYLSVVGPNGSGKTTLMKIIAGLTKPTSGSVTIFDNSIKQIPPNWIAYVPQIKSIDRSFPALPVELVASGIHHKWIGKLNSETVTKAMQILEKVGADGFAYRRLDKLSGGELQRIYLARALVRNPKILLLDEPATGIDMVCEFSINGILNEFNRKNNTTIIMVTHDWSSAMHHSQLVLMLNHKQIYFGKSSEAFTDENIRHTFSTHAGYSHDIRFNGGTVANS